jgi:hypothetical protein
VDNSPPLLHVPNLQVLGVFAGDGEVPASVNPNSKVLTVVLGKTKKVAVPPAQNSQR